MGQIGIESQRARPGSDAPADGMVSLNALVAAIITTMENAGLRWRNRGVDGTFADGVQVWRSGIMLSNSAQRVQDALAEKGVSLQVVELPDTTRTAREAAAAIGCSVGQIAKSLIFKGLESGRAVLVIASGNNRVNPKKIAAALGEPIGKANADFVRQQTGFVIGGVPPLGHIQPLPTFIDEDLRRFDEIWAAAGTPFAVFRLTPEVLEEIVPGRVIDVKAASRGQ